MTRLNLAAFAVALTLAPLVVLGPAGARIWEPVADMLSMEANMRAELGRGG